MARSKKHTGITYYTIGSKGTKESSGGVFRSVATPGSGVALFMSKRVYDEAAHRANNKIREYKASKRAPIGKDSEEK